MFKLVAGVKLWVVGSAGLPHLPKDLQPPLSKATQSACVTPAALAQLLVVYGSPSARLPAQICPKVNRVPQRLIAMPPDFDGSDLTGLEAHRGGSRYALKAFRIPKTRPVGADLG